MKKLLFIISASLLFLGGCAVEAVDTIPDEPIVTQEPAPFVGAIWIGTEYAWRGGHYAAVPGHWERPHGSWQAGHWDHSARGYRWTRGRWR